MTSKIKTVLVTGGAGYIGSHTIAELVEAGYEVISIDNFSNSTPVVFRNLFKLTGKKIENYAIDLCDHEKVREALKGKKFDAIIHFAAHKSVEESVKNPILYYKNNNGALLSALELLRAHTVPFFIFSSSAAIYDAKAEPPYTEESPLHPLSPYGMTKLAGERLVHDFIINTPGARAQSLRYFNPGGAHPSILIGENPTGVPQNLVPVMTKAVRESRPITIFGNKYPTPDGTCIRDYIHVKDVARAHVIALQHLETETSPYDIFNIGTGKGVSVMDMIHAFEKINNTTVSYRIGEKRPGDMAILYADTTKAKKILLFEPEYTLADIMKTAWEWEKKTVDSA